MVGTEMKLIVPQDEIESISMLDFECFDVTNNKEKWKIINYYCNELSTFFPLFFAFFDKQYLGIFSYLNTYYIRIF